MKFQYESLHREYQVVLISRQLPGLADPRFVLRA